jgi:hypothetical protein
LTGFLGSNRPLVSEELPAAVDAGASDIVDRASFPKGFPFSSGNIMQPDRPVGLYTDNLKCLNSARCAEMVCRMRQGDEAR